MPHPAYRSTLRRRLTLFYAALFFASGTAVLVIPLLSIKSVLHVGHVGSPGNVTAVTQHDTDIRSLFVSSALGLLVMAVLSVVFGWLLAGRLLRPLRTITATARDISASNLSRRLSLGRRDDEFAELGETLNDLFGRLEAAFDSQRHFVANASHELRTPLTAERALLQVALADPDAPAADVARGLHPGARPGRAAGAADRRAAHPGQQRARHRAAGTLRSRRHRRVGARGPRRGGATRPDPADRHAGPGPGGGRPEAWPKAWSATWWTTRSGTT